MKPPQFDYAAPQTMDEALDLLSDEMADAKVLAGGQSLVPLLSMRLTYPDVLVDLRKIDGLTGVSLEGERVVVGAMTTQHDAELHPVLRKHCPLVPAAIAEVAHPQIRTRGTVGGSIAHGDPAAELPAVVVALDAEITVIGKGGERKIAAADLYETTLTTSLEDGEVLTSVSFPAASPGTAAACEEVARRAGDYAMSGAVGQVTVEGGTFSEARLALFGISDTPVRVSVVEQELAGAEATVERIAEACERAADGIELKGDARADEDHARQLAKVVAKRSLQRALEGTE